MTFEPNTESINQLATEAALMVEEISQSYCSETELIEVSLRNQLGNMPRVKQLKNTFDSSDQEKAV